MDYFTGENITDAFYNSLEAVCQKGVKFQTLRGKVKELTPVVINIKNPKNRCLVIPYRYNSIIANIAELLWTLAGRDDLYFMSKYLPQTSNYSLDGVTWRAAYGKRLTDWYGLNQIEAVLKNLKDNKYNRQSIMNINDPAQDLNTRQFRVPCNDFLQFVITKENKLNLYVTMRANDVVWGFSGPNFFIWSVLQQMLSNWLDVEMGEYYQFVGSFDLFERHFKRAKNMLDNKLESDLYKRKITKNAVVDVKHEDIYSDLDKVFAIEEKMDSVDDFIEIITDIKSLKSEFFGNCLKLLYCYKLENKGDIEHFFELWNLLPDDDFKLAAHEYFMRKAKGEIKSKLLNQFTLFKME